MRCKVVWVALLLVIGMALPATAAPIAKENYSEGWQFPTIGAGRGTWDASVGLFLGKDEITLRNLQLRADMDLGPGLRLHTVTRSNREMDRLGGFHPHLDEGYLEVYGFRTTSSGQWAASLRVGNVRYLHFPYPEAIDVFDQVPGISDLQGGAKTGYSGELLTLDYKHASGWGAHATGIHWDFGHEGGSDWIEHYISYRHDFGLFHFEAHVGGLALRPEPLGQKGTGYNLFLGRPIGEYQVGILYENIKDQPIRTGLMVTFPANRVTKALGKVAFDYDRSPEGFAMQLPLAKGSFGPAVRKEAPLGSVLVGEVKAERIRTYWQNGQVRNFYEHRVSSWGEQQGAGIIMVIQELPWYLQTEALVSPHNNVGSWQALKDWEKDRQGPAQLSQTVIYRFYRMP